MKRLNQLPPEVIPQREYVRRATGPRPRWAALDWADSLNARSQPIPRQRPTSVLGVAKDFICPKCEHQWSAEPDADGLFDRGTGSPHCPICNTFGSDPHDYGDFTCPNGHEWRVYGNGGLVLGMVPNCPRCGLLAISA